MRNWFNNKTFFTFFPKLYRPLLVDVQGAASATTLSGLAENLATQIIEAARRLPRRLDLPYPNKNKLAQDPTAVNTIIHLTRCQPYLVQLTCYEIVEQSRVTKTGAQRDFGEKNRIRLLLPSAISPKVYRTGGRRRRVSDICYKI
jgi:AAA+ ATPase superfamily predicted ATPase